MRRLIMSGAGLAVAFGIASPGVALACESPDVNAPVTADVDAPVTAPVTASDVLDLSLSDVF